jgi:hypothetical protein
MKNIQSNQELLISPVRLNQPIMVLDAPSVLVFCPVKTKGTTTSMMTFVMQ